MNAQTAAREICSFIELCFEVSTGEASQEEIAKRVQQAIDEAVKEERERYLALAMKWRTNTREDPFVKQLARPFIEALESLTGGSP